jgi:cyclopropane fatty-acyl-phospholipid synthase-like methyltransferase
MPNENPPYPRLDYDEHARTRPADDFWGQVCRTVHGVPVADEQIQMIVDAACLALQLKSSDTLLDIACGNGALSRRFFDLCAGFLGIDLSTHLISVAKANFEALPRYQFMHQDALQYVRAESRPERFSKVLCYGSFSYFSAVDAAEILRALFGKFRNVQSVYIGNLPDRDLAAEFYKTRLNADELADCHSKIGIWRTRTEFAQLAMNAGWKVTFSTMPSEFFASHYRYDALLTR